MPLKTCSYCGAPFEPTAKRQAYCPTHQPKGRVSRSPTTRAQDAGYRSARKALIDAIPTSGTRCHWCPTILTRSTATTDHVIPVARGGSHTGGNLVLACSDCNNRKGDRPARAERPAPAERHASVDGRPERQVVAPRADQQPPAERRATRTRLV